MHSPDQIDVRVRDTLDGLTSTAEPAPAFSTLVSAAPASASGGRRLVLLTSAAAAALIGIATVAVLASQDRGTSPPAGCVEGLRIGDAYYELDTFSDGRLAAGDLGELVGRVDRGLPCEGAAPDPQPQGIAALGVPVGSEIRAIPTTPVDRAVAAVTDDGVRVFRAPGGDVFDFPTDVLAIGVNSDVDGRIRFATIDDPDVIAELLVTARAAATADEPAPDDGLRYLIQFERADGLVDVVTFAADIGRLGDRIVDQSWSAAVEEALRAAPGPAPVDGVTLTGADGTAVFHRVGACRHDRPDLAVRVGETLTATLDPDLEVYWTLNPPIPAPPGATPLSEVGRNLVVPPFDGTMIVDASLVTADGVSVLDACTTLAAM